MTDAHTPDPSTPPSAHKPAATPAGPEQTAEYRLCDGELDAGLQAAFDGDSGPPLAAGGSVIQALEAATPGSVRRVQLRQPDDDLPTPVNVPASEQMPGPQHFPERYQLVGEIARGGMGAIFKGRDVDLGRDIAVKMILETHKGRTEMLQRFVEEAQIGGQLQHPGIVPVYELGQARDRRPYFTMKLVKGKTLAALLQERPSGAAAEQENRGAGEQEKNAKDVDGGPGRSSPAPPLSHSPAPWLPRLLGIFEQVCQTMAYAHARGVIHRDLKPSNIMVGNFGEIQVMDWGLAKVLKRSTEASRERERPEEATVIRTARSDEPQSSRSMAGTTSGSHTAVGSVLGTPAYMAPEQARGEVDTLDERCDVFGLGAILCQILTGQPPYASIGRDELRQQARQAALDNALARVDACGADAALITLARQCLQANKEDRPRDAGVVAQAMTAYLESVQVRLQQAQVERAAALARAEEEQRRREAEQGRATAERARADEEQRRRQAEQARAQTERQRRRLAVALAAAGVLLVAGVGAAGWWYQQDRLEQTQKQARLDAEEADRKAEAAAKQARLDADEAARQAEVATRKKYLHQEIATALQNAELPLKELTQALKTLPSEKGPPLTVSVLMSDIKQWESRVQIARAFWQQARKLADSSPGLLSPEQMARLEKVGAFVGAAEADYEVAYELDSIRMEAATLIEGRLNTAHVAPKYESLFLDTLKLDMRKDSPAALAQMIKGSAMRYILVAALDHWTEVTEDDDLGQRLLEVSRAADPDAWRSQVRKRNTWQDREQLKQLANHVKIEQQTPAILSMLALLLNGRGAKQEAAALLRTTLVHYPADFWLNFHLGNIVKDPGEKIGCFRAALAVRPSSSVVRNNLGLALAGKNDLEGAIREYRKSCELDPSFAYPHYNLGNALYARKNTEGAIKEYRKAIELDPNYAQPHNNLGLALQAKGDLEGAIKEYRKTIELDPKLALAHNNLGLALRAKGDLEGAIKEYRKTIELDPKDAVPHNDLGLALNAKGDLEGAIKEYQKAIALDPKFVLPHNNLGNVLKDKREFEGAINEYQKAMELDPKNAVVHYNLGRTFGEQGLSWLQQGQFAQAKEATLQAVKMFLPGSAYYKLGQKQLKQCDQGLQALDQKLTSVLQAKSQPKDSLEQLALADLCWRDRKLYATAVKFYASGLVEQPALAKMHRYHAACAAALAAAGKGKDADRLDAPARAKLRQQALAWLKADLELWQQQAKKSDAARQAAVKAVSRWQSDPDLAGVRDQKALAELPKAERQRWQDLWADVADFLHEAKS